MNDPATNGEGGAAQLALEFRSNAFLLHQREGESWREAAAAPLEAPITAPDFDAAISRIGEEARAISGTEAPAVELWLPPERVLISRLKPDETPEDALAAAPAPVEKLVHDLSSAGDVVVITEYSVVEDALRYARRWGFAPTRVTARVALRAFPMGPDFAETAAPPRVLLTAIAPLKRLSTGMAPGLALAAAAVIAVLAIFVAPMLFGTDSPPRLAAPAELAFASPFDARVSTPTPADPARPAAPAHKSSTPATGAPKPEPDTPSDAPRALVVVAPPPLTAAGGAPIRPHELTALAPPVADAAPPGAPVRVASGPRIEATPDSPPADPPAATDAASETEAPDAAANDLRIVTAAGTPVAAEDAPVPAPRPGSSAPPESAESGENQADQTPGALVAEADSRIFTASGTPVAPENAPPLPIPRPGSETPAAPNSDAAPPPEEAPVSTVTPTPPAADAASDSPEEADSPPGPGSVARAPAPKSRPDALDMTPSDRIATLSPSPSPRPNTIRKRVAPVAVEIGAKGVREVRAPKRPAPRGPGVANAATLKGAIQLEDMNLLGVFGADGARRALLRLADGQVLRVSRGTVVEGWVVSRIDATSMRITRGGEARVLDLVQ